KKEKPDLIIGIGGCMSQEEETVKILREKYPQVDIIFGTHNITSLPDLLHDVYHSRKRKIEVFSREGDIVEDVPVTRFMRHKAWVNVMYGCDKFCTYCIVPYTRGRERSRKAEDILREIRTLVEEGYREVCLLGQNVNAYGKDLKDAPGFGELLRLVAGTGIERIRYMTSHPWDFKEDMILAMKDCPNIMPYVHLPVQSGDDEILRKMNRRYTVEEYKALFDRIKAEIPDVAVTTDIIVGFPNESDEAFEKTLDLVDYCKYDNAFTFVYSPRKGTPAARMEDSIPLSLKEERLQILNKKVADYANRANQPYLGKEVEVLVDGLSKRYSEVYSGYTPQNKLVNFTGKDIHAGDLVNVKISEVMSFSLKGEKIEK
ncbi:MAG: tRNA (N6-isopentenyl adenosine(37)-C2)-methylthiotransferase MiaB, partial [Erysipelotrichaceae bacterium]|nr:tRNA (N6-isopentenyl adenosine(37)-C2)-methylthiotransferase MiaB [Erysipelotrichaceae bacterium]